MKVFHILPGNCRGLVKYIIDEDEIRTVVYEFWSAFSENAKKIATAYKTNDSSVDVYGFVRSQLAKIHPALKFRLYQTGPLTCLAIHCGARLELAPLAFGIFKNCPHFHSWSYNYMQYPLMFEFSERYAKQMTGGTLMDIKFCGHIDKYNCIHLLFIREGYRKNSSRNELLPELNATLGFQIGDLNFYHWVETVETIGQTPRDEQVYPLEKLYDFIYKSQDGAKSRMPPKPYHRCDKEWQWHLERFEPQKRSIYTGRTDLYSLKTIIPDAMVSAQKFPRFDSVRYSNFEEIFCYLKMEKVHSDLETDINRENFKWELNSLLIRNELGMVTGVGDGLQYWYIDFVLANMPRGMRLIRRISRKFKVPLNSWIQFFDVTREAMWVNIYDESPDPPLPDFEGEYAELFDVTRNGKSIEDYSGILHRRVH